MSATRNTAINNEADRATAPMKKSLELRCYMYREKSGLYVAECIDLDLTVKAKKPDKVIRELQDAVFGYVRVACETGSAQELIPRPAPLSHKLRYHVLAVASRVLPKAEVRRVFYCPTQVPCFA